MKLSELYKWFEIIISFRTVIAKNKNENNEIITVYV